MKFQQITIPYAGRELYPSRYGGEGKSGGVNIKNYGGGLTTGKGGVVTTPGGQDTGGGRENRGGNATSFFAFLSKTSGSFSSLDLTNHPSDTVYITGYRGYEIAQVLVGDITKSAATATYDIQGIPSSGLDVVVSGNGTTAASITLTFNSTLPESAYTGTLDIPIAVNINDNSIDPYHYTWYMEDTKCMVMMLHYSWVVRKNESASYYLDLSNQSAQVNCDADGNLQANSIATLQCTASTSFNGAPATGITYEAVTESFFGATGFSINPTTGVFTFNSGTTNQFFWSTHYPALPIIVLARKTGETEPIGRKTMTISRNYPGSQGEPAVMRWVETDKNIIRYNPNTGQYSETAVTGTVWKQVGDGVPTQDTGYTIYQWYNDYETGKTSSTGSITAPVNFEGISGVTFALKNTDNQYYEVEEVPVLAEGVNGAEGPQGPQGGVGPQGPQGGVGPQGESGERGESNWRLSLSNDNASVNCDASGHVLSTAVLPSCSARTYYGGTLRSDVYYQYETRDGNTVLEPSDYSDYHITIDETDGVLTVSLGEGFDFNSTMLQVIITAYDNEDDIARDTKTFSISKSIAGAEGIGIMAQWSVDGINWHNNYQNGDLYMRQSEDGGVTWSGPIRVVGETGPQGPQGGVGPQGPNGDNIYKSFVFTRQNTQPATPTSTSPIPEHNPHTEFASTITSVGYENWERDGYIFTHSSTTQADIIQFNLSTSTSASFRIKTQGGGFVRVYLANNTVSSTYQIDEVKGQEIINFGDLIAGSNTFRFQGWGKCSVEVLNSGSTLDSDWNDSPLVETASTIEYSATGDFDEVDDNEWESPSSPGNNKRYWEKLVFTTVEDGQYISIGGSVSSEKRYDIMVITALDITDAQFAGITGATTAITIGSVVTSKYSGEFDFSKAIVVPSAGNHHIYIGYLKDASGTGGDDYAHFWVNDSTPMWMTSADVENGVAGQWSTPIRFGSEPGKPAVSYWLETDTETIIFDNNTSGYSPTKITATAYKQVGAYAAITAPDAVIKYRYYTRGAYEPQTELIYPSTGLSVSVQDCKDYQKIRFYLYVGNAMLESEDVDILRDGKDGVEGRNGAVVRGPYDYYSVSAETRMWYNGKYNSSDPESEKWLDVIIKDNVYYYCNTTYQGPINWNTYSNRWTSGQTFDFVATQLLLADNAKIKFLSDNELYLLDSAGTPTAGAKGGSGINFWAGSGTPGVAPFQVNSEGVMTCKKGVIGGWEYDEEGLYYWYDGEDPDEAILAPNEISIGHFGGNEGFSFNVKQNGIEFDGGFPSIVNVQANGLKVIFAGGRSAIPQSNVSADSITTDLDIYGESSSNVNQLGENGLNIKTPVYVNGGIYSLDYTNSADVRNYSTAVMSPFGSNLKTAIITSTSSSGTYFTRKSVSAYSTHWFFNNDMDLGISTSLGNVMKLADSSDVNASWTKLGDRGVPSSWVGMWCAVYSSATPIFYPTGIYGPTFNNRKGDTLYFEV